MTKEREALKLALEALEHAAYCVQNNYCPDKMGHDWDDTITAIKEALAQPAQPVQPQQTHETLERELEQALQQRQNRDAVLTDIANLIGVEFSSAYKFADLVRDLDERIANPPLPVQPEERYFCQRCGKPVNLTTIHTCTPPRENT
jgi:hypothetical protein